MKKIINLLALLLAVVLLLTSCSGITDRIFGPDYKKITNEIFTNYIEMNLLVEAYSEGVTLEHRSQGSGVIYAKDSHYYYCLTNAHVIETAITAKNVSYTVIDCYGKQHNATFVHADVSRDLAVLKFIASESLCVVELAESDPPVGENVAVLSNSLHLINAVTYGKVQAYNTVQIQDEKGNDDTRVTFPVIWHNAPMWSGASGSVLLNMDMELVGINYAVGTEADGKFVCAYAVSVSQVREYLEENKLLKP